LVLRFAVCFLVGLCLPARQLFPEEEQQAFVGAPATVGRLRGSHPGPPPRQRAAEASGNPEGSEEEDAAALRAKVAELEKRLGEQEAREAAAPPPSSPTDLAVAAAREQARRRAQPVNPDLMAVWEVVKEDLTENFEQVKSGQAVLMGGVQMKGANEDGSAPSIYRRKYDLMGASLKGQEAYLKAIRGTVKVAKDLESVKKLKEMMRNGYGKLDRREMAKEIDKLSRSSSEANIFFTEIMPGILEDPVADTLNAIIATIALLVGLGLLLLCFFPPVPPPTEE